jgi:hypothetical protein
MSGACLGEKWRVRGSGTPEVVQRYSFSFGWQLLRALLLDDHVLDWNVLFRSYMYVGSV